MTAPAQQPVAVVGLGAIMPQAPDAGAFWANITGGRYCVTDVPAGRWNPDDYYDPDPLAPDKTYSRIGGWVTEYPWDPIRWKLPVPPNVAKQLDLGQQWAIAASREALLDAGWPNWNIDSERVAVVLGNAIGGEKHYQSNTRIEFPEFTRALKASPAFGLLPTDQQAAVLAETKEKFLSGYLEINEDTMPGELSNVIAGRVCALFNLRGPNFTTDAACASGLAATQAAVNGLVAKQYDAVIAGGVDHNMSISAFVRFCKIGALSATGTRPFDAGADGFVMGEGCSVFVLKRLTDAERDGDRIYAVLLGIGGSSDGKGKGITAPNPVGQRLAVERAWTNAGLDPSLANVIEAHGTSTRVGDAAELTSLTEVFGKGGMLPGSIAVGSVKSNIGHLKAAAGGAGLFKMVRSLHERVIPPSLNYRDPNPNVDWNSVPFRVNTELREWPRPEDGVRRGGVSAFGFGGTNFHIVCEEHVPGRYREGPKVFRVGTGTSACPGDRFRRYRQGTAARSARRRRHGRHHDRHDIEGTPQPGPGRCDTTPCGTCPSHVAFRRPGRGRFRGRRRSRRQAGQDPQGLRHEQSRDVADAASARRLRRSRSSRQGGVPVHRARLAVREHAQVAVRARVDRARHVRRSRLHHDSAARPAAHLVHLR